MTDLDAAAQRLRDSRESLPNWAKWWQAHRETVESGGAWPIAEVHDMSKSDGFGTSSDVAAHIALTASPHVTEALEHLLDQINADCDDDTEWIVLVEDKANRLASAILHTDQHDGSAT